jgi:sugar lactone lactonase YvrE
LATLFITTAREGRTPEQLQREPLAGSVFVATPGVVGCAAIPFGG